MKLRSIYTIIILFLILFPSLKSVYAQNKEETQPLTEKIESVKNKLQLKLLLNSDQLKKVDKILVESIPKSISKEPKDEAINSINTKVETVLTKKQKIKFEILKSNWLDELFDTEEKNNLQ